MQRYGKICTNTRKRTKKFTLSQFLTRFFASITVTTPLALGSHPEDARRVRDVLAFLSSLYVVYRYIPDISIVVYPIYLLFLYTFGIPLVSPFLSRDPIPATLQSLSPKSHPITPSHPSRKKSASISARA